MLPPLRTNSSDSGKAGPELRVVAIGGGTGLSTLLNGLKRYVTTPALTASGQPTIRELSGVVTVSDDGGSSGACARNSTCFRRAMCGTASWRSRKTKRYCRGCFSTALTKDRDWKGTASEIFFSRP